ncbi:sugar phosphate nucleotidyltransferase [Lactococcus lactis]|uniref:sugar phosphate nucleotidyltransferase n=1 Tax=Lactococcus lactis TaxID=1358 RepID=UPI00117AB97E|nr:sugar phosphate nucleotidyltransferase [Lactococcus lactis]TRW74002.1 mannose-1-phosphate guanylyltransferase [Lactococcus lactis]
MKIVLLSGGSGKRLWPLSNSQRSKQFIKALKNESGSLDSMVQRVWKQLDEVGMQKDTYIAIGESQLPILKSQIDIDDDKIIVEPSRRDTFPAIALTASYLYSVVGVSKDETMVVLPVDPYVDARFFERIKDLERLLNKTKSTLGLVGINPTFPSEKYGYIIPDLGNPNRVKKFQEKPKESVAKKLIEEGAVWNAGVFGLKISTLLDLLDSNDYYELSNHYDKLPKNSFDYEFSEKQQNISFIKYEGYWKDLGTWNTLTEEVESEVIGHKSILIDTKNTHVINETSLSIAAIGVEDLVISAGPEGILVSTKEASPKVKEIPNDFFNTINYIEEYWGTQKTIYHTEKAHVSYYELIDEQSISISLAKNQRIFRLSGKGKISYREEQAEILGIDRFIFVLVNSEGE